MKRMEILGIAARVGLTVCLVVTAPAQSSGQPLATGVTVLPDGTTQFTIHNSTSVALTAYVVETTTTTASESAGSFGWFRDSMQSDVRPVDVASDANLIVARPNQHPQVTFRAALFQDGSVFGDSGWVLRLQNRRTYAARALASALADTSALAPAATSLVDLGQKLKVREQAAIAALQTGSTTAEAINRNDQAEMLKTYYTAVELDVTRGCSTTVTDCVSHLNAIVGQRYAQLLQVPTN